MRVFVIWHRHRDGTAAQGSGRKSVLEIHLKNSAELLLLLWWSAQRGQGVTFNSFYLSRCAINLGDRLLLQEELWFDWPWIGWGLQGLDGEGGVEAGLHVVVSGALLGAAGWRALLIHADRQNNQPIIYNTLQETKEVWTYLGQALCRTSWCHAPKAFWLVVWVADVPPLALLYTAYPIGEGGVRLTYKLIDKLLAAHLLYDILKEGEKMVSLPTC